jgi:hypothetical protein
MTSLAMEQRFTAAVFALTGMMWGVKMGIADNFTEAPAHAHLNLVGWASMALMGAFYGYAGDRAPARLGWANYAVSTVAVVIMVPSLAILLAGGGKINPGVISGSLLALVGMALFLASVVTVWFAPRASA